MQLECWGFVLRFCILSHAAGKTCAFEGQSRADLFDLLLVNSWLMYP